MTPSKKKILLVDNKKSYRETVRDGLELAGYTVIEAESREEALEKFKQSKPALAIVDVRLVDDGKPEDYTGLKLLADLQEIPVIMVTAYEKTQLEAFLKMDMIPKETPRPRYILEKGDGKNLNNIIARVHLVLREQADGKKKARLWLYRVAILGSACLLLFGIFQILDKEMFTGFASSVIASVFLFLIQRYYK
jgi:CheY-like chemotaxis protein